MRNDKWNAFRNRFTDKMSVFKREENGSKSSKNLVVIISAALLFGLVISSITLAGQIKANRTAKETSKTVETFKLDTLNGGFQGTMKVLSDDMSDELSGVNDFLGKLDQKVLENLSKLEEVNTLSEENTKEIYTTMENNLKEIQFNFSSLEKVVQESQTSIRENLEKYIDQNNVVVNQHLADIEKQLTSTQEQIQMSRTTVSDAISDLKTVVKNKFDNTEVQITNMETNLTNEIAASDTRNQENFNKAQEQLSNTEKNLTEKLDELHSQIVSTQEQLNNVYVHIDNTLSNMKDQNVADQKELLDTLSTIKDNILSSLESDMAEIINKFTSLQASLDKSVIELKAKMDDIHSQITSAQDEIKTLLNQFEGNDVDRQEETMTGIADVNAAIDNVNLSIVQINADLNTAHQDLVRILGEMKASNDTSFTETISRLESVETNINSAITQDMAEITQQYTNMANNFKVQVDNLSQAMTGKFDSLNQSLAQQFSSITNTITNNTSQSDSSLREYIDQKKAELQQDLNQVFISVSSGKANLASALLTKGVSVNNDASFTEIKDAILNIPQQLLIGVQQIPGNITYHYHYHTDAAGNSPHSETSTTQGGCYTIAQYHVHSEEAGCYTVDRWHEHNGGCPGHSGWVDWDGDGYWGWFYECNNQPLNASRKVLNCPKTTSTIEYYNPSCGWVDGQITGAEITYDKSAFGDRSLQAVPLSAFQLPEGVMLPNKINPAPDMIKIQDNELEKLGLDPSGPSTESAVEGTVETEREKATESEVETEPATERVTETESVVNTEMETERSFETEMVTESTSESEPESESTPETVNESETEPVSESTPETESAA